MRKGLGRRQPERPAPRQDRGRERHQDADRARPHALPVLQRQRRLAVHSAASRKRVRIPVVVNGDIVSLEDARTALDQSRRGRRDGRGAPYGKPWFLKQVIAYLRSGTNGAHPSLKDQLHTVMEHYQAMLSHYGVDAGLRIARKHLGWYSKGLPARPSSAPRSCRSTNRTR
jgi:tRNA-dihydrouridine synthase